jgi:hypothetical protein
MDKMLIFGLFKNYSGIGYFGGSLMPLKKIQFFFFKNISKKKKRKRKTNKSWQPTKKMCLSGVNLDVLILELNMKDQFANFC